MKHMSDTFWRLFLFISSNFFIEYLGYNNGILGYGDIFF